MLKRILHLSLLFISLSFVSLYAFDFSEFGFRDIQKRVSGSYTVYSMSDAEGRDVKISLSPDVPEARVVLLLSAYTTFDQWDSISFDTISVIAETEYTSFMALPTRISYNGVDLLSYVRSGLSFIQENDSLIYDIRLVNAAVNPKLSGSYTSEQELLKALYEAVEIDLLGILYMGINQETRQAQPVAPAQESAPQKQESALEKVQLPEQTPQSPPEVTETSLQPLSDEVLADMKSELKVELNEVVNEGLRSLKENAASDLDYEVKILTNEIDILSQVVSQDREDRDREAAELQDAVTLLQQDLSGIKNDLSRERDERKRLEEEVSLFREELDDLRKAILTIHNTGIFGNIRHVDRKAIDRAVSLKDRDEDITQSEMYTTLNREGYAVSEHAVFLIYALYFNEYY
ncbi:MAG: hypothetical protein JXK93_06405 [Sphaerochaetaceae bacterium]|nr:hypothetical protein [Sphaerochaetaceae bacterium]